MGLSEEIQQCRKTSALAKRATALREMQVLPERTCATASTTEGEETHGEDEKEKVATTRSFLRGHGRGELPC